LKKAFDCLNHNILLSKLQFYGVTGKAKSWFESYLHNRYMGVQISNEGLNQTSFSALEKITDGVPQGLVLGPLLFLIYVNNLPKTVNDKTVPILFADDTSIIVKSPNSKDFQTNMLTAFNCVNKWFKVNLLSINIDKTHYIQYKTKNKPTLDIHIVCDDN
jgi:glutathionyl-hydroquinone reductase